IGAVLTIDSAAMLSTIIIASLVLCSAGVVAGSEGRNLHHEAFAPKQTCDCQVGNMQVNQGTSPTNYT
ncbi:hypothetical protein PFISCL1PPCAC_25032, partial [Pristionchus fissidentatus]